jgi:hypothetical protein
MTPLHRFQLLLQFPLFLLAAGTAPAEPTIHKDASIQWEDAHFQAKPDGNLMYLVTTRGVLVESSKFNIQAPDGSRRSNMLPWEMRQEIDGDTLRYSEPVRIKGSAGSYRVETSVTGDRKLRIATDFDVEGYRAVNTILNLPLDVFTGDTFIVDGEAFAYTEPDKHPQGRRFETLLPRRAFTQFISSGKDGSRFILEPQCELEIEVQNRADWKEHRSYWVNLYSKDGRTVAYTVTLPEPAPAREAAAQDGNMLANSSFELGREEWGVIFGKRDVSSGWSLTAETASDGEYSLKVDIVPKSAPFEPERKSATIASDYFQAQPLERLTISADMKASRSGQRVALQLRLVPTELVPNKGSTLIGKELVLTDEWQRYSFEARLPLAANNAYAIAVEIDDTDKATQVYLDAVTVSRATDAAYAPAASVEARTDTRRFRRLYMPGEPFDLVTSVRNNSDREVVPVVRLAISDDDGKLLHEGLHEFETIPATANARIAWQVPPFTRQGMYRIHVSMTDPASGLSASHGISLGVLRDRDSNVADPSNRFGTNITDLREFWALERIGLGWSRFTFDCGWGNLQPSPNWWNKDKEAALSALLDYQATFGVTPLAVLGPGMPKWASRAPKGSSAFRTYTPKEEFKGAFVDYLNRLLKMADGRLFAIETWNEPDIPLFYRGTEEEMAEFTTLCYEVIKAHDPEIQVVGLGLATPAETKNKFLRELIGHTGLQPYDAISFHPYTEGRRHPARGDFRDVVHGIGETIAEFGDPPPLWATEFGWFGRGHDTKPFVPYKNPFVAREILDEGEGAAAWVQAISTAFANGVDKVFYFTLLEGNLLDLWLHGWVGPGGRSVESGFIAAAAACDLMRDVDCLGQDDLGGGSYQTRFSGPSGDFVVLWNEAGGREHRFASTIPVRGKDLFGNDFTLDPADGNVEVSLSGKPLYLFINDISPEQ